MKSLLQPAPISTQTDTDPGPDWRTFDTWDEAITWADRKARQA